MALSPAQTLLLHELFILATGKVANTPDLASIESLVGANGDMTDINALINRYLGAQEAQIGKVGVIQTIANNSLGFNLTRAQAGSVVNDLANAGLTTWSSILQWAAASTSGEVADIINHRGEAATYFTGQLVDRGTSGFFEGATVTNAVANLLQGIGQSSASLDASKQGLLDLATQLSAEGIQSSVVDGYVAGAFVFADANGNSKHDSGEWSTTTNAAGNYTLPRSGVSGTIIASGGTDIMTNKAFKGVLTAPAGSTVVNPLTTLVQTLFESGQSLTNAKAAVSTALGLPPQINPTSYDPLKVLANTNSSTAAKEVAMDVQTKALQIANIITLAANAINSASGSTSTLLDVADAVFTALAGAIKAAASTGATIDLTNTATLTNIIQTAATASTTTTGVTISSTLVSQVATITAANNVKADQAVNVTDLAKAMVISQGAATDAIISGAASGDLSTAVTSFTGTNLDTAVNAAIPGFLAPGVVGPPPTPTPTPTPTPEPTPTPTPAHSPFTVTNTAGLITFGGRASGDIDISITAGTATFSRQSITAATTVAAITTGKTIELAAGQTLSVNSADVTAMNGVTLKGAGTLKSTDGLTVAQLNSLIYTDWTGTRTLHSVADTSTNLKNDTRWVTGAIAVTVTDAAATLADLKSIEAATTGLVNATAITSTSGSAADALLLLVTNEGMTGDKIDMKADVAVTLSGTTVSLADLKSIQAATTGFVNATAITSTSGTYTDALLLLTTNEGTSGDKIDMKDDVAVTITDTPVTLADLKTIESKTTGLVNATAVTTTSGTMADAVLMLFTNEATGGNKIDMKDDVAVTISDSGSIAAADLVSINGKTTGLISVTGATAVTGSATHIKAVVDALGTTGDKLNVGMVTGAATNATLTVTSGASNAADAAAILAGSSGAVTVRLDNSHTTSVTPLLVAAGDVINIDPSILTADLTASAQALVTDVNVDGEWHFDSGSKLFTWWDGAQNSITLTGAGATVTVGADTVSIGIPTFAVTNSSGTYTVGAVNGAVALTVVDSDFVFTPTAGDPVTIPFAGVNSLVVNSITLTATPIATTNLSVSGTGGVNVSVGALQPTGTYALTAAADVITATTGANIAGINTGNATTAATLNLTGAITMTLAQHQGFTSFSAPGDSDEITITDGGAITAGTGIDSYVLSAGGANNLTVLTGVTDITGSSNNATNVIVGAGLTVSGTWALGNSFDVITAANGSSIAGVNGGTDTTAETLNITGTVSMTAAQHGAIAIAVGSSTDAAKITTGGTVNAKTTVGTYNLSSVASNTLNVNAGKLDVGIAGAVGFASTVDIGGKSVTGTWNLLHTTSDTIKATNGAVLTGLNSGGATTAENLDITGSGTVTMTAAQHNGLAISTTGTDILTIVGGGTLSAKTDIETYKLQGGVTNLTVVAGTTGVNLTGVNDGFGAVNVAIGGLAVNGTWSLAASPDQITATDGSDISGVNGGAATTAERLQVVDDSTITMTTAQYLGFSTMVSPGTADRIVLTTALNGGQTLNALIENFTLAAGAGSVALGVNGQSVNADALTGGQSLSLAGGFSGKVSLTAGNLTSFATGAIEVTGGTSANTITTGLGSDTINAGDGADFITGGAGIDTLNGENGNDTFAYAAMGDFVSGGLVVDLVNGGADTDALDITGAIVLTATSDLTRMTNVEQIKAHFQSASAFAHSIVVSSNGLLGGVNTIDLSNDGGSSTATLDFTGVTTAMTLKGIGAGVNTITGGSGADTLIGGSGSDLFIFGTAAAAATDTAITGGGGADTVLFRSTAGETLVVGDKFSAGLSYLITTNSTATANGTTTENINASTHTLGGVALTGNAGDNILTGSAGADTLAGGGGTDTVRGGGGNDTITTVAGGTTTYVFEATASANGVDTLGTAAPLTGVRSGGAFKFSNFLVTEVAMKAALVLVTDTASLDLTGAEHIGVRYGSANLNSDNIKTLNTNTPGEVIMADNSKAVVFSFTSGSSGNSANGSIYYVEDVDSSATQNFQVTLVGTMTSTSATILQIVNSGVYN